MSPTAKVILELVLIVCVLHWCLMVASRLPIFDRFFTSSEALEASDELQGRAEEKEPRT